MNNITKRITLTLACLVIAASAYADERVRNAIVAEGDQALTIKVPNHRHFKILNFIQDSDDSVPRGTLTVSKNGATATVLSAAYRHESEIQKDLFIAGSTEFTVAPVTGATLFIAYKIGEH